MTVVYQDDALTLHAGDCLDVLPTLEADSIDAVVTDPPYDLVQASRGGSPRVPGTGPFGRHRAGSRGFMGAEWDATGVAFDPETWRAVLRVARPGAWLLSFGGTRTYHRLVCAIEDAGWEVTDHIVWLYAQGMPKGDTTLKPAHEPIVLARKRSKPVLPLQIDEARIPYDGETDQRAAFPGGRLTSLGAGSLAGPGDAQHDVARTDFESTQSPLGRWPANVVLTDPVLDGGWEGVVGGGNQKGGGNPRWRSEEASAKTFGGFETGNPEGYFSGKVPVDTEGSYSRFFLVPKAGRRERNAGLDGEERPILWSSGTKNPGSFQSAGTKREARNHHPTVKPVELMDHLVRLVTPRGGLVLDPFLGSGSTAIAAIATGRRCVGIERDADYLALVPGRMRLLRGDAVPAAMA